MTNGTKTKVALIGAGGMANTVHYPSLAEFDDVELVALCDLVPDKLKKTADKFGVRRTYTDYMEMLRKEEFSAVYILMPPHHLFDLVINCVRAGKNVFIEKPPAITTFQVEAFVREAEAAGVLGMVGFNRRYIPMMTYAREKILKATRITQVVSTFYKNSPAVYYNGAIDLIGCDSIHAVDALRWMAGSEPRDVATVRGQYDDCVPNAWNAIVRFENGATGILLTNWKTGGRVHTFEMHGPGASAFLDPDTTGKLIINDQPEDLETTAVTGSKDRHKFYGFWHQSRHFIDCVKENREPCSSFQDALKTMRLVDRLRNTDIGE
ncbi:MAG TPA: Gfo/Idh/MocA family oxidoreductase [Candidatus Brocadiia bacterium]|nr:Gfo/Idh/MocA family oxidoreductase [Candidatus Brocadiia bacterium]